METNTETNETPDSEPTETSAAETTEPAGTPAAETTETTETTRPAETTEQIEAQAVPDAPAKRRRRPRAATVRGMVAGDVLDPRNTLW